jgi:hypothetical protein
MSPTTPKCVFVFPDLLLSKSPFTALYRCLPVTFASSCHVYCIRHLRFPILSARQCRRPSTPCRQLQNHFSYTPDLLLSKSPFTALYRCLPDTFPSRQLVHCVRRLPLPILLAFQCRRPSTPCRRHLFKVLSYSRIFYLVKSHSRPVAAAFPALALQATLSTVFPIL